MEDLIRKPYKISLWEDEQWYVLKNNDNNTYYESTTIDANTTVCNDYIKEVKIADIGGDTINSPIKAFAPKLVNKLNGTNELTFSVYYRYYDEETYEWR